MANLVSAAPRFLRLFALFILGCAVFEAAYCQAPLYYSNQNQYFLHGLANAGEGFLREDWLAGTRDSTPLFSALVTFTVRFLHPGAFYFYHALLLGAYAAGMLALFVSGVSEELAARRWPLFVALFIAAHSALASWCSARWFGQEYPWFLQAGLAGQYTLGAMLQPSMFGVLLIVSIALFVRDRIYLAVLAIVLAASLHFTYLLPAAFLVLGMMAALFLEQRFVFSLTIGAIALLGVSPIVVYVGTNFESTSPDLSDLTKWILVNERIPHHCRPDLWFDGIAALQIAWVFLAVVLARPTRLRTVLAVATLAAVLLTLLQVATRSTTLALLFPWRISAILVPLATTVLLSRFVGVLPSLSGGRVVQLGSLLLVAGCAAFGLWITVSQSAFRASDAEELPVLNYVRDHREAGQVYLLPVTIPNLAATTRGGTPSSNFKPPAAKKQDGRLIPPDLQRFRLYTGVPIYVDFKAIPYQDWEVLEWNSRLHEARGWQRHLDPGFLPQTLTELQRDNITHLIVPAGTVLTDERLKKVHEDATYSVYQLRPAYGRKRPA